MGIVSTFIGLLPSYEQIGVAAPILLVLLRLVQGLAVGAEWGGAVTMAVEHAPANCKALYGAAPMMGLPAGLLLSRDRKSTRLNSSHVATSYAVFCLKKKKQQQARP